MVVAAVLGTTFLRESKPRPSPQATRGSQELLHDEGATEGVDGDGDRENGGSDKGDDNGGDGSGDVGDGSGFGGGGFEGAGAGSAKEVEADVGADASAEKVCGLHVDLATITLAIKPPPGCCRNTRIAP